MQQMILTEDYDELAGSVVKIITMMGAHSKAEDLQLLLGQ